MIYLSLSLWIATMIYGALLIFAKDVAWPVVKWSNSVRGVMSERTAQWETYSTFQGGVVILLSFVFICRLVASLNPAPDNFSHLTGNLNGRPRGLVWVPPAEKPVSLDLSVSNPDFALAGQPHLNGISLTWHLAPGYIKDHINRSQKRTGPYYQVSDGGWEEHGVVHYTDHTAVPGVTYYYVVSASSTEANLLSNSEIVKITCSNNKEPARNRPNYL